MTVTGGQRLDAWVERMKRAGEPNAKIGFFRSADTTAIVIRTAYVLEFGADSQNLASRPAFRIAILEIKRDMPGWIQQAQRRGLFKGMAISGEWPQPALDFLVSKCRDAIKESYLTFESAEGLSERQRERKRGTPYQERELVGGEGPKLVEHIKAVLDGREV